MTLTNSMWRYAGLLLCAPLLLLAGCPQSQTAAPGSVPAQATAPSVAAQAAAPVAQVAAPPAENAADAQKVQQLISKAEASYRSGVDNYRANRLDAARVDFDAAVDVMLTSGMDLKGDPQLADEFDRLLNAVNSLEMAALKQGNGFSTKLEDAPLDEASANEVTFAPNAELTAKVTNELKTTQSDFPLVINNYVAGYINYFSNSPSGHAHLLRSLERAGRYKDMISKNLREQGVPQDLIYLAVAESGFQPQALNPRSGAGGMWQFMPTGAYGLARNGYFDERFDPAKSSVAYARYMKELYDQFGDWYLAMAAYDWGPGNVQRAVQRTGYADFWELYKRNVLPGETKNYVPGIIAAIIMAKNPTQYGLDKLEPEPPAVWDTVTVDDAIDLQLVADVTNASLGEIVALNPSLLRMSTPTDMSFDLHIPVGTKGVFTERIKDIPEGKRTSWRFHVAHGGETLETIATNYHAHASDIAAANGMKPGEAVEAGDELVIPGVVATMSRHQQRYTVRHGDTLVTIADRFNVSVEDLRNWNHLDGGALRSGTSINVAEPVHAAPSWSRRSKGTGKAASASSRASTHSSSSSSAHTPSHSSPASSHVSAKGTASSATHTASSVKSSSSTAKKKRTASR